MRHAHLEHRCEKEGGAPCTGFVVLSEGGARYNVERLCDDGLAMRQCECLCADGGDGGRVVARSEIIRGRRTEAAVCACDFSRYSDNVDRHVQWTVQLSCANLTNDH